MKSTKSVKSVDQSSLLEALTAAGYELDGFTRKGDNLIIRLSPASMGIEPDNLHQAFPADCIAREMGLQSRCHVFAAIPHDLLILTVLLPQSGDQSSPTTNNQQPSTDSEATPSTNNQQPATGSDSDQ